MITCNLCGKEMKGLTLHLLKKHFITPKEYCKLFPDAKIFDDECLLTDSRKAAFDRLRGKPKTEAHRRALSEARKKIVGWKHAPETIEKMKATWDKNREAWSKSLRDHVTPERRLQASKRQSQLIVERGYQLGRSTNVLEKIVEDIIIAQGYTVSRQIRSLCKIQDKYRYYDLFVVELDLIIEIDGEYWHKTIDKINLDLEKEKHVREMMKHHFVRVSDKDLGRRIDQDQRVKTILDVLTMNDEEQIIVCKRLIQARLANL